MAKIRTSKGWFRFKRKHLYLGIKQIDKVRALDNLKLLMRVMDEHNITCGPTFGTLLGIVRDNDFITWDEDIDLFIFKEDEQKLRDCLDELRSLGLELVRYERLGLYSFMRNGEYMDIYVLSDIGCGIRTSNGGDFVFEKDFKDLIEYDFKGISLKIPRNYEAFLEFSYGDWRTPVQYANFNLSWWRIQLHYILSIIKLNLPDSIYFKLLRRHHRKDFVKFIRKCKDRGITFPEGFRY